MSEYFNLKSRMFGHNFKGKCRFNFDAVEGLNKDITTEEYCKMINQALDEVDSGKGKPVNLEI